MINKLLKYFDREINGVRFGMDSFRKSYRKESDALNLNERAEQDPNVSRMIDSFSWLTAKNNIEIDKLKNQHVESMIGSISPNLFKNIPDVIHYELTFEEDFNKIKRLEQSDVLAFQIKDSEYKLTPAYSDNLLPCFIESTNYVSAPFDFDVPQEIKQEHCIRIVIQRNDEDVDLQATLQQAFTIHSSVAELKGRAVGDILQQLVTDIAISSDKSKRSKKIQRELLRPLVCSDKHIISPIKGNEIPTLFKFKEFFGCKEKHNYFYIEHLPLNDMLVENEIYIDLFIDFIPEYQEILKGFTFHLNRGLLRNVFKKQSEPINVNNKELSYPVFADSMSNSNLSIYSLDNLYHVDGEDINEIFNVLGSKKINFAHELYWDSNIVLNNQGQEEIHLILPITSNKDRINNTFFADIHCSYSDLKHNVFIKDNILETTTSELPGIASIFNYAFQGNTIRRTNNNYWNFLKLLSFNPSGLLNSGSAKNELIFYLSLLNDVSSNSEEINAIKLIIVNSGTHRFIIDGSVMFVSGNEIHITLDNEMKNTNYYLFAELLNDFYYVLTSYDRYIALSVSFTSFKWAPIIFAPKLGERSTF